MHALTLCQCMCSFQQVLVSWSRKTWTTTRSWYPPPSSNITGREIDFIANIQARSIRSPILLSSSLSTCDGNVNTSSYTLTWYKTLIRRRKQIKRREAPTLSTITEVFVSTWPLLSLAEFLCCWLFICSMVCNSPLRWVWSWLFWLLVQV